MGWGGSDVQSRAKQFAITFPVFKLLCLLKKYFITYLLERVRELERERGREEGRKRGREKGGGERSEQRTISRSLFLPTT